MEGDSIPVPAEVIVKQKAEAVQAALNALASSVKNLSARSRGIPSAADFFFYHNFPDFRTPARLISAASPPCLSNIAGCPLVSGYNGSSTAAPFPKELEDAVDWLANLNDDLLERFGASMDEFQLARTKQEESARASSRGAGAVPVGPDQDGFQTVCRKKNKQRHEEQSQAQARVQTQGPNTGVMVAQKDRWMSGGRAKVPFHIGSMPRPQDEYRIVVDNRNAPFEHVWLDKSEDASRRIHPLEKLSVNDFVDRKVSGRDPLRPPPLEFTPFKLVEDLDGLKQMADKLKAVSEFAVDLEHNAYRSFLGLTCLMQISTRSEDFVVDTLKLRTYIGPYLRDLFKDPSKRKVLHGADHDILWLQKDFGIYVCNLFDTGQASRVLQMERNSLQYLLHHFCDVAANKEYQGADWRLRPLPQEMVKYAREDTHYLLYIYDIMRTRLLSESTNENDLLLEVHKRSNELCMQMYEKELLTDTSYLHIHGLQESRLNAKQLAVVAGLYQWRDKVAREEDESTGYILPNRALLQIGKKMPLDMESLGKVVVKGRHPFLERYINNVLDVIRASIANSSAFESTALLLEMDYLDSKKAIESSEDVSNKSEMVAPPATATLGSGPAYSSGYHPTTSQMPFTSQSQCQSQEVNNKDTTSSSSPTAKEEAKKEARVQMLKRPAAFGALFGKSSSSVRKPNTSLGGLHNITHGNQEESKNKNKVEKIISSVALPFHNFTGVTATGTSNNSISSNNKSSPMMEIEASSPPCTTQPPPPAAAVAWKQEEEHKPEEVMIALGGDSETETGTGSSPPSSPQNKTIATCNGGDEQSDDDDDESDTETAAAMTPSELSSSFEKCFESISKRTATISQLPGANQSQPLFNLQLKPFDYSAARKHVKFGDPEKEERESSDGHHNDNEASKGYVDNNNNNNNNNNKGNSSKKKTKGFGGEKERQQFLPPRRRQAFPPSGNRTFTYS